MTKTTKWILSGVAALAVSGLIYAMPAIAAEVGFGHHGMMMGSGGHHNMMSGDMAAMHKTMMPLMSQMPAMHEQAMNEISPLFGLTAAELTEAMAAGNSLTTLAEEKGVAIGEVRAIMTRTMKSFLDQMVEQGSLTQEDAGRMMGLMEKNMGACLSGDMSMMHSMMSSGMMKNS